MKKNGSVSIVVLALCIVALFIPTYIAIAAYMSGPAAEYEQKQNEITDIYITDIDGKEYAYSKSNRPEMLGIFNNIFKNATPVSMLSDSVRATPAYTVRTSSADGDTSYRFYFSVKGPSYYEDGVGAAYGISEDSCSAFFGTECALTLFYNTHAPALKNTFGTQIIPQQMSWSYLNYSGTYSPVEVQTSASEQSYELDGSFSLSFDVAPDYTKAVVYSGSDVIYNGTLDGIASSVTVTKSTVYKMEIEAEWYKDKERDYCGNAKYVFSTEVTAQALFSLGANSVEAGQVAVINAENIKDPSHISVTFTPALRYKAKDITPVFYGADGTYSALVAIPASCFADNTQQSKTMKYQIDIKYGSSSYTLNLDVTDRTNTNSKKGDASAEDIKALRTDAALQTFSSLISENASKTAAQKLWDTEKFYSYYNAGYRFPWAFGRYWELATGEKYANEFVQYKIPENKNVLATNSGTVLAVGENDYLGKYIVIDHGMGLQTWYLHLGEISVSVSDSVSYKHVIGKTGRTGFVENSDVGFAMMFTVNGVPVCPYAQSSGEGLEETGLNIAAFK